MEQGAASAKSKARKKGKKNESESSGAVNPRSTISENARRSTNQKKKKGGGKAKTKLLPYFEYNDLGQNEQVSQLLKDLVEYYTSNSNLPENELKLLNKNLYKKTVKAFLDILNSCVEKIACKLLTNDKFKDFAKKVEKKDAFSQTDISNVVEDQNQ